MSAGANQYASSCRSGGPSRVTARPASIGTPVRAAISRNAAAMPGRVSSKVMSRSKPMTRDTNENRRLLVFPVGQITYEVAMTSTFADHLRALPEEELMALIRLRPDLVVPPPSDFSALAHRAQSRLSVARSVDGLDTFGLEILDALRYTRDGGVTSI